MISVIVPVYKVEPYLRKSVESILNQTYSDLEILLIDDGSPDRCGEICDEYEKKDSRVRVFHTENRGVAAARNLGLREAKGDLIGFVDPDDWIEPEMYEILLNTLNNAGADISVCGVWNEYPSFTNEKKRFEDTVYTGKKAIIALLDENINGQVWNKLYRRELLRNLLFPGGKTYEDIEFMDQVMIKMGKVATTSSMGYHYRHRNEGITQEYSAKILLDYAEAFLNRSSSYQAFNQELFKQKQAFWLQYSAQGISKVWRWWHGCSKTDKKVNKEKIEELKRFSRAHFPFFGDRSWPMHLRVAAPFLRSSSPLSFACLYYINQAFRFIFPDKSSVILK